VKQKIEWWSGGVVENGSSGGCGFLYKFGGDGVYSVMVLGKLC